MTDAVKARSDAEVGLDRLSDNLRSVMRGKDRIVEEIIIALIAGGSVLIEERSLIFDGKPCCESSKNGCLAEAIPVMRR